MVSYTKKTHQQNTSHSIEYWTPKGDWTVTQAEVITIAPRGSVQDNRRRIADGSSQSRRTANLETALLGHSERLAFTGSSVTISAT